MKYAPSHLRALLLSAFCFLVFAPFSSASSFDDPNLQTTLITMGPGEEIWEQFAHNAIWIHDPDAQPKYRDAAFNYGIFQFGGDFIPRFIKGSMRYMVAAYDVNGTFEDYRENNRTIITQQLNLSANQSAALSDFLWNNVQPENRYYTYNYFNDNCSTRVRDALNRALGGQLQKQTQGSLTPRTYRYHALRVFSSNIWVYIGVDFSLGQACDRPLSRWDEMFLPEYLRDTLRGIQITDAAGKPRALVTAEQTLFQSTRPPVAEVPPLWRGYFLLTGLLLSALLLTLAHVAPRWRLVRWFLNFLVILWVLLTAFAGGFLVFVNLFTNHWAAYSNENLLQMSPLALLTFLLLPWALRHRPHGRNSARRIAAGLAIVTFVSSLAGLGLKFHPAFYQENWNIILWVLPVHLAIAIILCRGTRMKPTPSTGTQP